VREGPGAVFELTCNPIITAMNQQKNIHFSLLIRISKRLFEFNFRKRSDGSYDGDTGDDRGNRHYFKMIKQDKEWQLQGSGLPKWITENDKLIAEALQEKESVG